MFKSSFSKYITAFVIIILLSFLMLSGIITSIIKTHAFDEKKDELKSAARIVSEYIEHENDMQFDSFISIRAKAVVSLVASLKTELDIIITDNDGRVLLATAPATGENDIQFMQTDGLSPIDVNVINGGADENGFLIGTLGGFFNEEKISCAVPISNYGYIVTFTSADVNTPLVKVARNSLINSSVWVMLAAVIATYFITERIIHPLKNMTVAAKKFAKGDFSTRINVYGHDEVSELATAFNNMAESLDSLEKMRSSFLANISHDLRTPMTTISGFIDGIISGAIPPERHEYYLGVISAEVHRLSRLVSQLLDVSRLESGERKFNFTDFDIAEVARLILISFEQKIDTKKLDVSFESEEDEMFVFADKDAIYQVLYNLCHNAIKFSKDGGEFKIAIGRCAGKKIFVSVFDEGQIIDKDETKLVFDRFYKTDKSRGLDKTGVGLGLYISKTIIDAHEESIEAISIDDRGCEFRFTLKEGTPVQKRRREPPSDAK